MTHHVAYDLARQLHHERTHPQPPTLHPRMRRRAARALRRLAGGVDLEDGPG